MQTQVSLSMTLQPPVPQFTMQLVFDQSSIRVTDGIQDYVIRLASSDQHNYESDQVYITPIHLSLLVVSAPSILLR